MAPRVLMLHGIWRSGVVFAPMQRHLGKHGIEALAMDLTPSDGSVPIERLGEQVAERVDRAFAGPFDLVAFSMGGIVARYYLQRLGGIERVERFVSIASPHQGTLTAHLSKGTAGIQMRPKSAFLEDLNRDVSTLARLDVTSIWTPLDLMILPAKSSVLPVGREILVRAPMHGLLLRDGRCLRAVAEALKAPRRA